MVARLIADGLQKALGQSVIVEPRPGASGTTAAAFVAARRARRLHAEGDPVGPRQRRGDLRPPALPFGRRLHHDLARLRISVRHVHQCGERDQNRRRTARRRAQARPAPLLYGTPGVGSGPQLAIELFALKTKIKVQHVPFRGSEPAVTELRRRPARFHDGSAGEPDRLRAQRQAQRARRLQRASTISRCPVRRPSPKAASPDSTSAAWQGLIAPAGLPDADRDAAQRRGRAPAQGAGDRSKSCAPSATSPRRRRRRNSRSGSSPTSPPGRRVADEIHFQKI